MLHVVNLSHSLCSTDTVKSLDSVGSLVPVKLNNSISDGLLALTQRAGSMGGQRDTKREMGNVQSSAVCLLQNAKKKPYKFHNTHALTSLNTLEVPTFLLAGISFKCQIIHLERVTQTFRDLL